MEADIFKVGRRYKAKLDFKSGASEFISGEILKFVVSYYIAYDSSFTYEFLDKNGATKTWWRHEDLPASTWKRYFRPVGIFG